jgi:hypothetical protein
MSGSSRRWLRRRQADVRRDWIGQIIARSDRFLQCLEIRAGLHFLVDASRIEESTDRVSGEVGRRAHEFGRLGPIAEIVALQLNEISRNFYAASRDFCRCGNYTAANTRLDEALTLANEKGAMCWKAGAMFVQGEVFAKTGKSLDAITVINSSLAVWRSTGTKMFFTVLPSFFVQSPCRPRGICFGFASSCGSDRFTRNNQ